MAETIETIDAVARRLGRDVIYLRLVDENGESRDIYSDVSDVTDWFDRNGIGWQMCTAFNPEGVWIEGGPGALYIDVVYEPGSAALAQLDAYLFDAEGNSARPGYIPSLLLLSDAMINAAQDDESFWDDW